MGRRLRYMNDATKIKEWTEAMDCVFKTLETCSRNKDVSTPMQMGLKKIEIHRGQNINVLSRHDDWNIKEKVVKKDKRITVKKKRENFQRGKSTARYRNKRVQWRWMGMLVEAVPQG